MRGGLGWMVGKGGATLSFSSTYNLHDVYVSSPCCLTVFEVVVD